MPLYLALARPWLTISDGGQETNTGNATIGELFRSNGTVTVTGENSAWNNTYSFLVGSLGTGTLTIADGGTVTNAVGFIGEVFGSNGTVIVTGENSVWNNNASLYVENGSLTIADGGRVAAGHGSGIVYSGTFSSSGGTLNIGAAAGETAAAAGTLDAAAIAFGDGTGTLNFNHNGEIAFDTRLLSAGAGTHELRHLSGTTTLTGDSSGFTGTTTIAGGTLQVGDTTGNGKRGGAARRYAGRLRHRGFGRRLVGDGGLRRHAGGRQLDRHADNRWRSCLCIRLAL